MYTSQDAANTVVSIVNANAGAGKVTSLPWDIIVVTIAAQYFSLLILHDISYAVYKVMDKGFNWDVCQRQP